MKVNGKDYPIYEMENKKCSKPPTRFDGKFEGVSESYWLYYAKN